MLLKAAEKLRPLHPNESGRLQFGSLLMEVRKALGQFPSLETEQEVLTQWHDLVRTGYFAWGSDLSNPSPPFFHFTARGAKALERLNRDPGNPEGYIRHLNSVVTLNPVAQSYVTEGLRCFEAGLFKASAVMIGAAAESVVLELRDATTKKLTHLGTSIPKGLEDWRVKTVLDHLHTFLDARKSALPREIREEFETYFLAFAQQIRSSRNDAGHPTSVEPVTEEAVHASYLLFPELARLASTLSSWVEQHLT